jgi:hypothetical protein
MTNALILMAMITLLAAVTVFLDWFSRRKDRSPHRGV